MGLDNEGLKGALEAASREGRIRCADALSTAFHCGITPAEAGTLLDEMGLRIERCQLGLFGYGTGNEKLKRIQIPDHISDDVAAWVTHCAEGKGHTTCAEIFSQAKAGGLSRAFLAGACEKMELKIKACQLGAF